MDEEQLTSIAARDYQIYLTGLESELRIEVDHEHLVDSSDDNR